jgi:hypothetical protein
MIPRGDFPSLGAAARRALPQEDATIDGLSWPERSRIAAVWQERARSELHAAAAFAAVSKGLFGARADQDLLWLAARAVCDEMRHSEICRHVASRYRGAEVDRPSLGTLVQPRIGAEAYAVLQGAVNETIGGAFLSACLEDARGPLVRAALRELCADETDHARLGWAVLAAAAPESPARREVGERLPALVRAAEDAWRGRAAELPESLPPGHGCLSRDRVIEVLEQALRELVWPGLAHLGFPAQGGLSDAG